MRRVTVLCTLAVLRITFMPWSNRDQFASESKNAFDREQRAELASIPCHRGSSLSACSSSALCVLGTVNLRFISDAWKQWSSLACSSVTLGLPNKTITKRNQLSTRHFTHTPFLSGLKCPFSTILKALQSLYYRPLNQLNTSCNFANKAAG